MIQQKLAANHSYNGHSMAENCKSTWHCVFEEAYERLKKASSDKTLMAMYRNREKAIRDWNDSINSARKDGVQQGVHLGEQRVNALYERLLQENRGSEIPKAIADPTFRTKLFNEYGI